MTPGASPRAARVTLGVALGIAACAAFAMRLQTIAAHGGDGTYLAWATSRYVGGITPGYLSLAEGLLAGQGYSFLGYPPGYALLIAAMRLAGAGVPDGLRMAQAAIDCLGVPLVYFLMRRAGAASPLSLCAAATYAAYPLFAAGSTMLLAEFISPVSVLAALALAVLWSERDRPSLALLAGSGVFLGLSALVRPDLLLLPLPLALWHLARRTDRRALAAIAVVLAGFAVPVGAWGLHNRVQHGHWVFSSTAGGNSMWEGLGEIPNEHGFILDDAVAGRIAQEKGYRWLSVEADRYFMSEYLRAVRERPEFVAKVIVTRWQRIATESEVWLPRAWPIIRLQQLFDVGGFVLVGGALVLFRRSPVALLIVALPIGYAMASIGITHFEPRYTRYVHLSYLFAAFLIAAFVIDRLGRRSRPAGMAALGLACAVTVWAAGAAIATAAEDARLARQGVTVSSAVAPAAIRGRFAAGRTA